MTVWTTPGSACNFARPYADSSSQEILPHLTQWERDGEIPRELHRKAGALGLLGAGVPEAVGGEGGDAVDAIVICEEMHQAGASGGLFASLFTCGIAVPHMIAAGDETQIEQVGRADAGAVRRSARSPSPSPAAAPTSGHLTTTAVRDGDHYVVNGAKTTSPRVCRADFVVTAVRTGGPGAAWCLAARDREGHTGIHGHRANWRRWAGAPRIQRNCRLSTRGFRWRIWSVQRTAASRRSPRHFVSERVALAAQAYASAQRCLELTLRMVPRPRDFRSPLISRQAVQNTVTEMARKIDVARVYTHSVIERPWPDDGDLIAEVCFAKNTAVETGEWVANQAVQLFGGLGYMRESEVERQYRDMRILGIGGGTTEILTGLAAKRLGYQS